MGSSFISFAGQNQAQSTRLLNTRTSLFDLQRQLATQYKSETFSGLGVDAGRVQRLRTDSNELNIYKETIDRTNLRTTIMRDAMSEASRVAREVIDSMSLQIREGTIATDEIRTVATENLRFLQDLMNSTSNGSNVFAGSDVRNEPLESLTTLNTSVQTELTAWLSGGQTPAQVISNTDALSNAQLGYSSTLQSAGDVRIKVDTNVEINYTVKADGNAFSELIKGVALAANLVQPDPSVDVATDAEFFELYDNIIAKLRSGVDALNKENVNLTSKVNLMANIQSRHAGDIGTLQKILANTELADTAETIVKIQSLQSQLTASYQVTKIVSQLTLVNFI